jgi:spectinomycin phosphotransferase
MREEPRLAREKLRACLQEQYDLVPATIVFLPLGQDTNAGVYRVVSEQGTRYLLKIKSGSFYTPSCLVPRYLCDQGIASVVAPLPTRTKALWTRAGEWTVITYPFLEGDTGWAGITDEHWNNAGEIFKRIHEVVLPASGFDDLRRESFDPSAYVRSIDRTEAQLAPSGGGRTSERALRSSWKRHRSTIQALLSSLNKLADILQRQTMPLIVCHADLHPGNLLRNRAGQVFVIDWDDVMLAPKERDFIFVGEPADVSAQGGSPFFQGYGQTEIDWIALTYYRYERVVQDLVEYAQQVIVRDDLSEETKSGAVRRFDENLEAAEHAPSDLTIQGLGRDDAR